ncbi:MAG: winged helix-turn-helix transcriptional regulator [Cyclobacteriaceae bacterium]|nr:winged helix-turn-helix transcriptional regulator [Cyclobacteriaceae bacterium]
MERDPFAGIADPTRRKIIEVLKEKPLSMNDLAARFPEISRPAVSKQVRYLEACGLVFQKQEGRERIVFLQLQALALVDAWLQEYASFWNDKLDGLGRYLDGSN